MADHFISAEKYQTEAAIREESDKVLCRVEIIAYLVDKSVEAVKVWIEQFLAKKLANKDQNQIPFIASLGREKSNKDVTNCFDLCCTEWSDTYPILKNKSFST